uniref:C-type lectin domain-containing protein n=1 Tax=Takifugu rubripes TaxID=31033 RepID=A0A3B5K492_TAKRU
MKTLLVIALVHCVALLVQGAAGELLPLFNSRNRIFFSLPPRGVKPRFCLFVSNKIMNPPYGGAAAPRKAHKTDYYFPLSFLARFSFCLDGWTSFRGSCYYLGNSADSWANAEDFCGSFGASLASVHNIWEYSFLQRLMKTAGHSFAWIGGYYFEGAWRWEDGTPFDYDNWDKEDSPDLFQCLQMDSQVGQGWSSHDCSTPFPFLCKLNPNC